MSTPPTQPRISEIWRYPVKSFGGERLAAADIRSEGIVGDRAWALVDDETGNVVSAKRVKYWGGLLLCRARLLDASATGDLASLAIEFSDGAELTADNPQTVARLTEMTGRTVRFQYATRDAKSMEMDWAPESQIGMEKAVEATAARVRQEDDGGDPVGVVPTGGAGSRYHDLAPIHLLTTSSVRQLTDDAAIRSAIRKYRPNLVVGEDDWDAGYVEDTWLDASIGLGAAALTPTTPVSRCVMVTLEHRDAPRDKDALRRIAQQHRVKTPYTTAPTPCLGLYTDVATEGVVRIGDPVTATAR